MRSGRLKVLVVSFAAVVCVAAVGASAASACSCAPIPLDESSFDRYDAAIIGKLVEKRPVTQGLTDYRFRAQRVYRGKRRIEEGSVIAVRSSSSGASCGLETGMGRREGLFLTRRAKRWQGGLCQTTSPRDMRRAAADLGYARTRGC